MKLCKIIIIACIISAIGWFGSNFGPSQKQVQAKVFERLFNYTKAMPKYLFDDSQGSEPRKVIVNSNTTFLSVSKTKDNIENVLDFYDKQISHLPVSKIDKKDISNADAESKKILNASNIIFKWLESRQNFRMERSGYGFLGAFEFDDQLMKLGEEEYFETIKNAMETGDIGKIGTGRVVIAMQDEEMDNTTIINIWTAKDFNIHHMSPGKNGDMPGNDIPDVPRYPGNRRIFSLSQENTETLDSVVTYSGEGSIAANILFFHSRMPGKGWKSHSNFENIAKQKTDESLLFYVKEDREVHIQVRRDDLTNGIITTVIERKKITT